MADLDVLEMTERSRHVMREHVEARLAVHRKKNDNDLSAEETAHLRGRIAECVHLLNQLNASEVAGLRRKTVIGGL